MTNKLPVQYREKPWPVRTGRKQVEHIRRYKSGKIVKVNPGTRKKSQAKKSNKKRNVKPKRPTGKIQGQQQKNVQRKPRTPWNQVLKKDDIHRPWYREVPGVMPSEERKEIYYENQVKEQLCKPEFAVQNDEIDIEPKLNYDEWFDEYLKEPLENLLDKYNKGQIDITELKKERKEIIDVAGEVIETDLEEPEMVIRTSDLDDDEAPHVIGHFDYYADDDIIEDIQLKGVYNGGMWVYDELYLPEDSKYSLFKDDDIFAFSEDAENLKAFDNEFRKRLNAEGIDWAIATTKSQNIFWQPRYYLVDKNQVNQAKAVLANLVSEYRDEDYKLATIFPEFGKDLRDKISKGEQITEEDVRKSAKDKEGGRK